MGITDWPEQERPRERLLAQGAQGLTDAELVAVCLRSGSRGKSAVDLARELIGRYQGLAGLLGANVSDLRRVKGLGPAKAAQLAAVLELARRTLCEKLRAGNALTTPGAVRDYLRLALGGRTHEVFVCIHLDAQHRVLGAEELFRGTLTQTSVYPREVVKAALAANAAAVIFAQSGIYTDNYLILSYNVHGGQAIYPHFYPQEVADGSAKLGEQELELRFLLGPHTGVLRSDRLVRYHGLSSKHVP